MRCCGAFLFPTDLLFLEIWNVCVFYISQFIGTDFISFQLAGEKASQAGQLGEAVTQQLQNPNTNQLSSSGIVVPVDHVLHLVVGW